MTFIKKYWLWILLLLAVAYGAWYWMEKNKKDAADKPADKAAISLPDLDIADSVQYDGSGIAAGIV